MDTQIDNDSKNCLIMRMVYSSRKVPYTCPKKFRTARLSLVEAIFQRTNTSALLSTGMEQNFSGELYRSTEQSRSHISKSNDRIKLFWVITFLLPLVIAMSTGCRNNQTQDSGNLIQPADSSQTNSSQANSSQAQSQSSTKLAPSENASAPLLAPPENASAPSVEQTTSPSNTQSDRPTGVVPSTPLFLSRQLARAVQLYKNGDYDTMRRQLDSLLRGIESERLLADTTVTRKKLLNEAENDLSAQIYAEATFLVAKSHFADDQYGKVLLILEPLIDELPSDSRLRAKALYLHAEVLSYLGRSKEAIRSYKEFERAYPEATQIVQEKIAAIFLRLGNLKDATLAYQLAADAAPDDITRVQMLEALAETYVAIDRTDKAIETYDKILSMAQKPGYRAQILFVAGRVLANADEEEKAVARWQATITEAPDNQYAYLALIELVNRDIEVDQYQRGYIDLQSKAYIPAIEAFETYLDNAKPNDKLAGQAMHYLGQSYLGAGNYQVASQVFERVIEAYPKCVCIGQAWLDLAESQAWLGQGLAARRTYRTFAREDSSNELAPEALWRSGLLAFNEGSQLEVSADFFALADDFPESERTPLALYIVGIGTYREGLYGQTERVYERMQEVQDEYRPDAVGYWLGRAYFETDKVGKADAEWRAVIKKIPDSFYGVMSALALSKSGKSDGVLNEVAVIAGPPSRLKEDDGSQEFAETWLAKWAEPANGAQDKKDVVWSQLPSAVDQDKDLQLGRVMLELDQRGEALAALERVYQRYQDKPNLLYPLSLEFERLGAYRHSLVSMEQLIQLSPAKLVEDTPSFLQQYVYPRRYPDLVEKAAKKHNIDPLLYYSLIRQESLFEPGARSYAAAQGLAQIIPDTAAWIAEKVEYPNFTNDLVLRPYINLDFGAFYLDWTHGYLDNNLISALVGYNAGPGNSRKWRNLSGPDDALFVEILTVNEPRLYILKITSNYYHYNRLYNQ